MKSDLKQTPDGKPAKRPPSEEIRSIQYSLFSNFLANETKDVSNTIEMWESIPKYFFSPQMMKKLRTENGLANPFSWAYISNNRSFKVVVQPALIEQSDGSYLAVFPSITEELIEEALKKIFAEQNGIHDPVNAESWVRFSLSKLHKELKERNRERNRDQIKRSIEIMSKCIITVYCEDQEVYRGAILSDLVSVNRRSYISDTESTWVARLPLFLSLGINQLAYRQYNYGRIMRCDEQLSRWLYKRLVNRFIQAGDGNSYHINFSEVQQSSGLLQMSSAQGNREKMASCLRELQEVGVLTKSETTETKKGKKITEIKYTLFASSEFIAEQKAANKRLRENWKSAAIAGIEVADRR